MKITIEIDTDHLHHEKEKYRNLAGFLLQSIGDFDKEETADPKENVPHTVMPPATASTVAPVVVSVPPPPAIVPVVTAFNVPPPPPVVPTDSNAELDYSAPGDYQPTNVLHFPVPPPPPPPIANTAAPIPPAPPVTAAAVVGTAAFAVPNSVLNLDDPRSRVDMAGLPWDARIHQKTGNKKKDGTWKIIKGLDPTIVAAVTAELAASKGASAPVDLLAGMPAPNTGAAVPVPPLSNVPSPPGVPVPPATSSVPVPPVATVGIVSPPNAFRELVDKLTVATKSAQITPAKVNEICQGAGAPNLMELNKMQHLIPEVNSRVDAFLAGLG